MLRSTLHALALISILAPASALALTASPDLIGFDFRGNAGSLEILAVDDDGRIDFKITLTKGKLKSLVVAGLDSSMTSRLAVEDAGEPGEFVKRVRTFPHFAYFQFKKFQVKKAKKAKSKKAAFSAHKDKDSGMVMTGTLFVDFEELAPGDMVFFKLGNGSKSATLKTTIVPEPATLLLMTLGLTGLAAARRRARG